MTKRVMRVPSPSPPWSPWGDSLFQTLRKPKPLPTIWKLIFSCDRSIGPSSYSVGLLGAEVLLNGASQRTQVNQPLGDSGHHQGSDVQQGSGPERYPEQGFEASPTASGIPPGPDF